MERSLNIDLRTWRSGDRARSRNGAKLFAASIVACACVSAASASWLPLQVSIVTLFLFAGPHNWFELRYFLMRLPVRFGRSRNFFIVAFSGIFALTLGYVSLPLLFYTSLWSGVNWTTAIASWNTGLLLWIAALVFMRGRKTSR